MAFRSTRRNGRSNDVWVMVPEKPESADLVLASPDGSSWGAVDFSPDEVSSPDFSIRQRHRQPNLPA